MLYGALFFDRLAPLHLVGVVGRDLVIPTDTAGALPLGVGIGWAMAMLLSQRVSRWLAPRERMIAAAGTTAVLGIASAATGSWAAFVLLRSIAGVASGLAAPAVTSLLFALAGVAMGALPLVLSIVPAEAVSRGDVGQALRVPIVTGELVGGALLPAIALAGWISEAVSVGVVAVALLATSAASLRLRPLA